jgi:hypothetical protein
MIKTQANIPQSLVTSVEFVYPVSALCLLVSKDCYMVCLSNLLTAYLMKCILEIFRVYTIRYLSFCYYRWVDTFAGRLLVPEGISHPMVITSTLTLCLRNSYFFLNLQLINKEDDKLKKAIFAFNSC